METIASAASTDSTGRRVGLDRLGTFASSACALHCALCAIAPAVLTVSGLGVLVSHEAEWVFTFFAALLAVAAAIKAYCPCGSWKTPAVLLVGVIVLFIARFNEALGSDIPEVFITVAGGTILVAGHLANLRACRQSQKEA